MDNKQTIGNVTSILTKYAVTMMAAGSHTARVIKCVARLGESFGYDISLSIFQRTLSMYVVEKANIQNTETAIKRIPPLAINFNTVSELSSLSWSAYDQHLPIEQVESEFQRVISKERYSRWTVLFLVACANSAFGWIFGADLPAMGIVFIATLIGFFIRQEMIKRHINHYIMFTTVSFIASLIAGMGVHYNIGETPHIAVATSVLFLIPGVPLINGLIDLFEGYVLMGISRLINAILLILFLSAGLLASLSLLNINHL